MTDPRCGTDAGHRAHFRAGTPTCERCREAHRRANNERLLMRRRRVPVIGSQRRIQALQALGWSRDIIAEHLGYSNAGSLGYLMKRADTVHMATAERIAKVYDRLSMTIPTGPGAGRARTWAKRHGYLPPLAWDEGRIDDPDYKPHATRPTAGKCSEVDEAVVLRVLSGESLPTTRAEKEEITRRWVARGHSMNDLERLHGWRVSRYGQQREAS